MSRNCCSRGHCSLGTADPIYSGSATRWQRFANSLRARQAMRLVNVDAATARTESRGCHRRTDFPEPRDVWLTHLDVCLDDLGAPAVSGIPAAVLGESVAAVR